LEGTTVDKAANQPLKVAQLQRLGVYATVVFVAFLIGFIPMWLRARTRANERDAVQQVLRLTQAENTLAAAAIQARRGDYEPAREAASTFYTNLRAELDRGSSVFSASQRDMLQPLLAQRDQMITLLARADPAVAERLADTSVSYRRATGSLPSRSTGQDWRGAITGGRVLRDEAGTRRTSACAHAGSPSSVCSWHPVRACRSGGSDLS
jgi:hypothetical protein